MTEFTSLRSHPSLLLRVRCASRSWVALPPNKLSPPHHLHKSIKSVLVEFEASRPPELVISRYETRIGAGENVRQMFARSEARSFVSVLVEGSFVSFISFFWGGEGVLIFFLCSFCFIYNCLYIIRTGLSRLVWLVKKFSFRRDMRFFLEWKFNENFLFYIFHCYC